LTLDGYQRRARETAIYPFRNGIGGIVYNAVALGGETGELLNKLKKVLRGDVKDFPLWKSDAACELGDVLWYLAMLADELGFKLSDVASGNLQKLAGRKKRGTLQGDGDRRSDILCNPDAG